MYSEEYIDGGVSANNPELAAIAHALSMKENEKITIDDIAVLSVGTGRTTHPYTYSEIKNWGLIEWIINLSDIFLDPPSANSEYICRRNFIKIGRQNYLRLDFNLNEQLTKREKDKPRKKLDRPYNKYIYQKDHIKKYISEEIDNPDICEDLIQAAQCYLDCGCTRYADRDGNEVEVQVKEAIENFIEWN